MLLNKYSHTKYNNNLGKTIHIQKWYLLTQGNCWQVFMICSTIFSDYEFVWIYNWLWHLRIEIYFEKSKGVSEIISVSLLLVVNFLKRLIPFLFPSEIPEIINNKSYLSNLLEIPSVPVSFPLLQKEFSGASDEEQCSKHKLYPESDKYYENIVATDMLKRQIYQH